MMLKKRKGILECILEQNSYAMLKSLIRCFVFVFILSLVDSQLIFLSGLVVAVGGSLRSNDLFKKATDFRVV